MGTTKLYEFYCSAQRVPDQIHQCYTCCKQNINFPTSDLFPRVASDARRRTLVFGLCRQRFTSFNKRPPACCDSTPCVSGCAPVDARVPHAQGAAQVAAARAARRRHAGARARPDAPRRAHHAARARLAHHQHDPAGRALLQLRGLRSAPLATATLLTTPGCRPGVN